MKWVGGVRPNSHQPFAVGLVARLRSKDDGTISWDQVVMVKTIASSWTVAQATKVLLFAWTLVCSSTNLDYAANDSFSGQLPILRNKMGPAG